MEDTDAFQSQCNAPRTYTPHNYFHLTATSFEGVYIDFKGTTFKSIWARLDINDKAQLTSR